MKNLLIIFSILLLSANSTFAFEDCVLSSDTKLTNLKVEPEEIVNINPIYTIKNEKNMFILQPTKIGKSKLKFTRNNDENIVLDIEVTEDETIIDKIDGIEIFSLDSIENNENNINEDFELDPPPILEEQIGENNSKIEVTNEK